MQVSLETLAEGAIAEKFDLEVRRVIDNIQDINTTNVAREINIKLKFKPNADKNGNRMSWVLEGNVTSKLAPTTGVVSSGTFVLDERRRVAMEEDVQPESIADLLNADAEKGIQGKLEVAEIEENRKVRTV
jgi:hypothetical protein